MRRMFKSKIHRASVTDADLEYEGSVTLDVDLMEAANIVEYEAVHIWNVTRGTRLETYALKGDRGSKVCCVNGAAAHLMKKGDRVIIATFTNVEECDVAGWEPTVVLVDETNTVVDPRLKEIAGPRRRTASA
ncbi:MAG: aspartate 1-decarboxylase [Myxococcales bacterium]|nr:aspartate 1-decarboxylase [Myxococcales bacterium]MCB9520077.1 aspartate 1-decarboxylase [Myxococcales bacterium]MCB9531803.1 aspartate 1-decarboxylase [Myxococcales bacterium]